MIEILGKDLLGRITRFKTKTGTIETPIFVPVVHPTNTLIPPREMYTKFGCSTIITNAYLLLKNKPQSANIHSLLDFPGSIMTDSGAYQLLVYGEVSVTPRQIIKFQERIGSDIAVILDVPTGSHATYAQAKKTVEETLNRARDALDQLTRSDILWVAPIQGGAYSDLVEYAAKQISKMEGFSLFAIGSPTQIMERYQFGRLVDLVMAARKNLPSNKPIHLFGAGHPLIFPLIVAMGCDIFDSAAYAIYARNSRLLTPEGTYRLDEIHEEFCYCPACSRYTVKEIKQLEPPERVRVLAEHNLYVCVQEIARVKQAIREGRLWHLLENRLLSHPALINAINRFRLYINFIERFSPVSKKRALFMPSRWSLIQPEVVRHEKRIISYAPPAKRAILLLMSAPLPRPHHNSAEYVQIKELLHEHLGPLSNCIHTIFLSPYFGPIPAELDEVYPLAQNEAPKIPPFNWAPRVIQLISDYLSHHTIYSGGIGIFPNEPVWRRISRICARFFKYESKTWICTYTDFNKQSLRKAIARIARRVKAGGINCLS